MKRFLFFALLMQTTFCFSQSIKISEMTTYGGNPKDGYVPVVISGLNRKVKISNIAQDKIDSISIGVGPGYDTLYFWKLGVKQPSYKLLRAGSSTWGQLSGSISAQADLQAALNSKQSTLVSGTSIKTVNNVPVLGAGNITISGSGPVDGTPTSGSTNPVSSGGVYTQLQKTSYHQFSGGGVQELDTVTTGPNGDTLRHRSFVDNSNIHWHYTSDGKGIIAEVVGGVSGGGASTATANSFVATSAQTMQRTADGEILTLLGPSAGGNSFSFRTNPTFSFINEIVSNRRLDLYANGIYFRGGGYFSFLNSLNAAPIATATSTATQSNSYDIVNVASTWNGSSSQENKAGWRYTASTTTNGEVIYGMFVNATGSAPDLFGGTRAIGVNNLTRKVTIDNLNDGATDGRAIIGSDGEIKKGSRVYGSDYATAGNNGTYVIPTNVSDVGVYTLDGNLASSSVTLPNPVSFPQREITIRNGSGSTIALNSYSVFWLNGSPAITTLAADRDITMRSDGVRWIRTGGNFTGL